MAIQSGINFTGTADANIPTPGTGKITVYDSTDVPGPAYKDDTGTVYPLQGATGGNRLDGGDRKRPGATGPLGPLGTGAGDRAYRIDRPNRRPDPLAQPA